MKKLLTLLLASSMALTLGAAAMANTLDVKVEPGTSVSVERSDFASGSYLVTGKFGINDQTQIALGYATESKKADGSIESQSAYQLGARYAFNESFAGLFSYTQVKDLCNILSIGVAGKKELSDPLALAGFAKYNMYTLDDALKALGAADFNEYDLMGQVEYSIFEQLVANAGVEYTQGTDTGATSLTKYQVGLKFAPNDKVSCYVDYNKNNKDDNSTYAAGVEYKF